MKYNLSGKFASREKLEERPFRFDLKTSVITAAFVILLIDIIGFYPKFKFHPMAHFALYAVFFTAAYIMQKFKEQMGARAQNRLVLALGVLYITLACVSGGIVSPLKWAAPFLAMLLFTAGDFKTGWILFAATLAAFAKDYASAQAGDIFAFLSCAGFGAVLYFNGPVKSQKTGQDKLKLIATDKDSAQYKTLTYGLLENILTLYHVILKPVSILFFIKNDDKGGAFNMAMSVSTKEDYVIKDYSFDIKTGVLGAAVNKNTFFTFDATGVKLPYYSGKVDLMTGATMPVVLNRVIGAIAVDFDRDIEGEKETVRERLKDLSGEIVSLMELYDINNKVITKEQRVSRMYDINGKLDLMEGKSGLMTKFFNEIRSFDIYSGYIAEFSAADNLFEITESFNYSSNIKGTKFNVRDSEILRYMMDTGKSVVIDDASKKDIPLNFKRKNLDRNFISLLRNGGSIFGFIKFDKEKPYTFADFEMKTLEIMLSRITVMLENAGLYEKIKRQAYHDGLTGLFNHLTFQEKLRESVEKCSKGAIRCVSLCVFDIDLFKKFNDNFGHQEGDRVLIKIANMLSDFEKKNEHTYCARYGGEEFVFVLENYDIYAAAKIADDIRSFSEKNLKGGNEKEKRAITVSVGVTSYPEYAKDAREIFKNADEALYLAKEEGRNAVRTMLDLRKIDRRKR
jgi:diguanylate cyclase (GGDEF)-like protein